MIAADFFEGLTDPRAKDNQQYPFEYLMLMALSATLAGIDSCVGIADYAETHASFFSSYFKLSYTPRHDTFLYILSKIDQEEMEAWFRKRANDILKIASCTPVSEETQSKKSTPKKIKYQQICIDGKTIRNSGFTNPFHVVSAWYENAGIGLGQEKVSDKSNEITAIPKLIESLEFPKNTLISMDAMGCQKEICQKIIDREADYIIAVKENQPTLFLSTLAQIEEDFENAESMYQSKNTGHGRIEKRHCVAMSADNLKYDFKDWPGLKAIYAVDSDVITKRRGKEKRTFATRYFVASALMSAEDGLEYIRSHWGIEVKLHWRLDVVMNEDQACIQEEAAAINMNKLRKMALNMLNTTRGKTSVASMTRKCMNPSQTIKIFDNLFNP